MYIQIDGDITRNTISTGLKLVGRLPLMPQVENVIKKEDHICMIF